MAKKTKNMRGGDFSQEERQQLLNNGFTEYQIELFQNLNISFDEVIQHINEISNQDESGFHGNSDDLTEQVTNELYNEYILNNSNISTIPHNQDDAHFMDINDDNSQGSLHLSDLNASQNSDSGYTTNEDFSQGGKKTKRNRKTANKNKSKKIKHKNKKTKTKNKRNKKTKKMRGGQDNKPQQGSLRLYKDENPQF